MKKWLLIVLLFITLIIVVLFFFGKSILLSFSGIKNPVIESVETIKSTDVIQAKYDWLAGSISKSGFNKLQEQLGVPGIIVFDKNGHALLSNRGEGCQITARSKLKELGLNTKIDSSRATKGFRLFDDLLSNTEVINKGNQSNIEQYKYIVVYTWAKYLPKQSKDMINAVYDGLKDNKDMVLVISLNLDYLNTWENGNIGDKIKFD